MHNNDFNIEEEMEKEVQKAFAPKINKKLFRLVEGQNIYFSALAKVEDSSKGSIEDFEDNISVKKFVARKHKLSAKEKEKRKLNLLFFKFGRAIALSVMLFALGLIGNQIYGYVSDYEHNVKVKEIYGVGSSRLDVTPDRDLPLYPTKTPERITYPDIVELSALKGLEEQSDDFEFWLYIDGTRISYYVLQSIDNEYYLKRSITKASNVSGSLFLDYRNRVERLTTNNKYDFGSNNIIYGHNMNNGTMFGGLRKFQETDYFFDHQYIYLYSTKGVTAWKIFSSYETTTEDYYIQTFFKDSYDYISFIRGLQDKSAVKNDVILTSKDEILTLSTCHRYNYNDGRFVVHAVKLGYAPIN